MVLPTLLYACEPGQNTNAMPKDLCCLRKLLKVRWQDKIPDTEILKSAEMQSVHTRLQLAQLSWTGHFTRMPVERYQRKYSMERTSGGKALPRWPEETLQRHHESISKGVQHTTSVLGTDCTGSRKVALPYQKGSR